MGALVCAQPSGRRELRIPCAHARSRSDNWASARERAGAARHIWLDHVPMTIELQ